MRMIQSLGDDAHILSAAQAGAIGLVVPASCVPTYTMNIPSVLGLLGFVAACFAAALPGAFFRPGKWFEDLAKPRWRPPNWLFAPVWSVLYLTIAVSGWLVWRRWGFAGAALPLCVYGVSLAINAAWSVCFFGLRKPGIALIDIALLWLSIAATIFVFYPVERNAALLLLPYLAWVSFASALNFAIWRMNPNVR
jgi:tryptophan-rich sensory protein